MITRTFSPVLMTASIMALGTILSGCSPAQFSMYNDPGKNGSLTSDPTLICDPFDRSNIVSATAGLKGSIHYLDSTQPQYSKSSDVIRNGQRVNADLFLSSVNVQPREFTAGFVSDGGAGIKDSNGQLLVEWFGLNLDSQLKLADGEAPGDYQLAVLSDDGATLKLKNSSGVFEPLIESEGAHSAKLACATKVVEMKSSTRLPMNLTYFQGPRTHIALMVMWRKIPAGTKSLADAECGKEDGNDYFFDAGTATRAATPKTPYKNLLARGWKPLSTGNFELQSGSNLCAL